MYLESQTRSDQDQLSTIIPFSDSENEVKYLEWNMPNHHEQSETYLCPNQQTISLLCVTREPQRFGIELIRKHCVAAARDNGYLRWLWCEQADRDIDWMMDLMEDCLLGTRGTPSQPYMCHK